MTYKARCLQAFGRLEGAVKFVSLIPYHYQHHANSCYLQWDKVAYDKAMKTGRW